MAMEKGQISFDLMVAILALMVFLGAFQALSDEIKQTQTITAIRTQEKRIAYNIAEIILTASSLKDADSFSVLYTVPKLRVVGEGLEECEISIGSESIRVSYTIDGEDIFSEVKFEGPAGINFPKETRCGEPIAISKS